MLRKGGIWNYIKCTVKITKGLGTAVHLCSHRYFGALSQEDCFGPGVQVSLGHMVRHPLLNPPTYTRTHTHTQESIRIEGKYRNKEHGQ